MSARVALAHRLWLGLSVPAHQRFRAALARPGEAQAAMLRRYLGENADTAFGRAHDFAGLHTMADYQARVPLRDYDACRPWMDRIAAGQRAVLTRAPVRLFEPTGGSTGGSKWIPYTAPLQREFAAAVAAWVTDLHATRPALLGGPAYWSISPPARRGAAPRSRVPVGFEADSAYLGGWLRPVVDATLAVPSSVRRLGEVAEFRRATLLHLLRARGLRLVSVWHPTFFTLLLEAMRATWTDLVAAVATGAPAETGARPPRPDRARARELERLGPDAPGRLWPRLTLISCWGDAAAGQHLGTLRRLFPGVEIQPKGLIATEAIVSIPYRGRHVLAVTSHVFEFVDAEGRAHTAADVEPGRSYSVVVTTGGGLYRYRLRDRVEVTGRLERTPCVRFVGKEDDVSDRRGEKLDEAFVAPMLRRVLAARGVEAELALLAPETTAAGTRYVLFLCAPAPVDAALGRELEAALRENVQYAYAVDLGQLLPAEVCRVADDAPRRYVERLHALGARLGDVKPAALSPREDWRAVFTPGA